MTIPNKLEAAYRQMYKNALGIWTNENKWMKSNEDRFICYIEEQLKMASKNKEIRQQLIFALNKWFLLTDEVSEELFPYFFGEQ